MAGSWKVVATESRAVCEVVVDEIGQSSSSLVSKYNPVIFVNASQNLWSVFEYSIAALTCDA